MSNDSILQTKHNVNLWIIPLQMSLAAVALFALTMVPDTLAAYHVIRIPNWLTMGGIDDARAILSAMLGCVSTVLALIFSVTLLVLSMVANLFGPRLLYRFVQDWVTQTCIGLFMAAFIYVFLVFLVTHQDQHTSFIPQISLITSWFLVLGAFGFLVFYSHRVAVLIQNPDAIGHIVDDVRRVVAQNYHARTERGPEQMEEDARRLTAHAGDCSVVLCGKSGYLQQVDEQHMADTVAKMDATIVLVSRPGQFVLADDVLGTVSPRKRAAELATLVDEGVTIGRHRVLTQDVEFGLAQIVEIGIRALSPAINDTFTGVACVDLLGEALMTVAQAPHRAGRTYDGSGILRVQVRPLLVPRLIKQAFDQIRQAAGDNPAVLIRLLTTLERLGAKMPLAEDRRALLAEADAVWDTATAGNPVPSDRQDISTAWQKARERIQASL